MLSGRRLLPLFPLNLVLFPGASTPLHVFEERYRLMMQRCLTDDRRFGVVLIKAGKEVGEPAEPFDVGTLSRVAEYQRLEDGRIIMRVTGERRFRIERLTRLRPYIEAEVEMLEEGAGSPLGPEEIAAVRDVAVRHQRLVLGMRGGWVSDVKLPVDAVELSYHLCALVQSAMQERQRLLEEDSPAGRIQKAVAVLNHEIEVLKEHVANELRKRVGG
ncbi:MAG: peptidase S16 [SAR202 cluster bacterium]|nr:peptidase S16 [SAR202 cluster bacterium]